MESGAESDHSTLGVLGVGAIGSAIVTGLCEEVEDPPRILLSPRSAETAADLARRYPTVEAAADNQAVVDGASVVLVCVRPPDADAVLAALRFPPDRTVISAVAGLPVSRLEALVAPATEVARAIPLPSVARREGITAVHPPHPAATALFDRVGETVEVGEEPEFEALSASTATVAAHFAYLGAIAEWLGSQGIETPVATRYVGSVFASLAPATRSGTGFERLAAEHATPGGINEQFRRDLERAGTFERVGLALDRVLERLTRSSPGGYS